MDLEECGYVRLILGMLLEQTVDEIQEQKVDYNANGCINLINIKEKFAVGKIRAR